jgi:cation-transporting ATPase 13A3/4/5
MTYKLALGIPRSDVESNLTFLGLLVMENKLKKETPGTIENLQKCKVKTVMATGDNVLTAISVARQCNIIDSSRDVWLADIGQPDSRGNPTINWKCTNKELNLNAKNLKDGELPWHYLDEKIEVAVTGKAFKVITDTGKQYPYIINSVVAKAKVFARMGPDDKACLVENIQEIMKESVGMCGDGANDCGALKTADAGISLSEAEASIAAPFTSAVQNIECVVTLLREGRAAMSTSF